MKTRNLIFCLLFLFLGTTIAWADNYYQPGSYKGNTTPRFTLEEAVGKKFFIYNTAINGNQDRTGFLRCDGVQFVLDKSKERDLYVYNENFVYTLEKYTEDESVYYAIKSINTGTYVNAEGKFVGSPAAAKLDIKAWDDATSGKSGVNLESWKYNVIANANIKNDGHGTTVFVVKGYESGPYWNGNTDSFATWSSDGHPFAFYSAHEVTSGEYLQDLHMYSRSDIYSAQVIYGCVQNKSDVKNDKGEEIGANLIDGDFTVGVTLAAGDHFNFHFTNAQQQIYIYLQRGADALNIPATIIVEASIDGQSWLQVPVGAGYETELADNATYTSEVIDLGVACNYVRISNANTTVPTSLGQAYILPASNDVKAALDFVNASTDPKCPLFTKTTAKAYAALVAEYNSSHLSDARLLSGVPIAGNKYRIYADAYDRDNGVYVNQEIYMGDSEGNATLNIGGSYHSQAGDAKKKYEWYCEQTTNGKLVFRNVADPEIYLGNGGIATKPYAWSIDTKLTHRFGVPLQNSSMQYLAIENGGSYFQGDVTEVHDQTTPYTYTYVDDKDDDDETNDETKTTTIEKGICTDFVFIPVPIDTEKKITISANELVERNTTLLFDADGDGDKETYPLPFSHVFRNATELAKLEIQLLCASIHSYVNAVDNEGNEYDEGQVVATDNKLTFDYAKIKSGDVFNLQFKIAAPFETISAPENPTLSSFSLLEEPSLYFIKNKRGQNLQQQARPHRAGINIEDDGPISTQTGKYFYSQFNQRDKNMLLVEVGQQTASSLFYFSPTEDKTTTEYYSVNINNATTVLKCASNVLWNTNGNTYYVQPHKTASNIGYNIGLTALNATNNPNGVWCSNHADVDKVVNYNANDDGATWEFVKVGVDEARKLLYEFITDVAGKLSAALTAKKSTAGYDEDKIGYYESIVEQMVGRASYYYSGANYNDFSDLVNNRTAKLLQFAQNMHMLEHEIEYALIELPELSDETKMDEANGFSDPHWYYVRNVSGGNSYATYSAAEHPMSLTTITNGDKKLGNLFYFSGEKNLYAPVVDNDPGNDALYRNVAGNNLIVDEYLKVHIHNFEAGNNTLVSKNVQLDKVENQTPPVGEGKITDINTLKKTDSWSIELEYELDPNFVAYNAYGSCLLTSSGNVLYDSYANEFQVYLKDDRSVVIKVNNSDDRYRFWHTQDHFTNIKVVITYSQKMVTLDVYNALGEKETKTITDVTLNNITALYSAMPEGSSTITSLGTYKVERMMWKEHDEGKDVWYILPSSNLENKGHAIVLDDAFDTNMGWAYGGEGDNTYVATDLGTAKVSTWEFVRVTDFEGHMQELLDLWNLDECTVYHAPLVEVYEKLQALYANAKASGIYDEVTFNKMVAAIREYNGLAKEEFFAPKADKFYTVRPAVTKGEYVNGMSVDADNQLKKTAAFEYVTKSSQSPIPGRTYYVYANATKTGKTWYLYDNGTELGIAEDKVTDNPAYMWTCIDAGDGKFSLQNGNGKYLANGNNYYLSLGNTAAEYKMDNGSLVNQANYDGGKHMVTKANGSIANTNYTSLFNRNSGATDGDWCSYYIFVDCDEVPEYDSNAVWSFEGIARDTQANTVGASIKSLHTQCYISTLDAQKTTLTKNAGAMILKPLGSSVVSIVFDGKYLTRDEADAAGVYLTGGAEVEAPDNNGVKDVYSPVTSWVVEEVADCESIRYKRSLGKQGHGTLMLGFDAKIPAGVEAFYPRQHGDIADTYYMSMKSYDGIIPANSPVLLKNINVQSIGTPTNGAIDCKFYYSETAATEAGDKMEDVLFGALYNTVVDCEAHRENNSKNRIYMLQAGKDAIRLYQIWENADEDGNYVLDGSGSKNNDLGGHVVCKANMAYWVLPYGEEGVTPSQARSFSLSYDDIFGGTTDIEEIEAEGDAADVEVVETIYDLQGRKLDEITEPGIYIVNGKKVIVK